MSRKKEVPINELYMPIFNRYDLMEDTLNHLMRLYAEGTELPPIPVVESVVDMPLAILKSIPKEVKYFNYGGNHRWEAQKRLGRTTVQIEVYQPKTMLEMTIAGAKDNNNEGPQRLDNASLRLNVKFMLKAGMTTKAVAKVFYPTSIKEITNTVVSQIAKERKLAADEYRDKHDGCTMKEAAEANGLTEKQYVEYREGQNEKGRKGTPRRVQGSGGANPAKDDNAHIGTKGGGMVRLVKNTLKGALIAWDAGYRDGKSVISVCGRVDELVEALKSAADQARKRVELSLNVEGSMLCAKK